MSKDLDDSLHVLENMMSHGIHDAEIMAASLRLKGWTFTNDPDAASEMGLVGEGLYRVRTPEGKQGFVSWYGTQRIQELAGSAQFFVEGDVPMRLFLAWILADQLARIVLGKGFDENGEPPGTVYENVYLAFKESDNQPLINPTETDTINETATERDNENA